MTVLGRGVAGGDWSQEGLNLPLPLPVLLSTPCAGDQLSTLGAPPGRPPTLAMMKTLSSLTCLDITVEDCDF